MIGPMPLMLQWLTGLISLAVFGVAGWIGWEWWEEERYGEAFDERWLWALVPLLLFAFLGRPLILMFLKKDREPPRPARDGEARRVSGSDGTELQVEAYGPAGAPALVMTHGWGMDSTTWAYAKRELSQRYRLIVWDLPGHGKSERAKNGRYHPDRFADDLRAVVNETGGGPFVLVGHSIGGMTVLSYLRTHAGSPGGAPAGVVLVNTTYTDPLKTMIGSGVWRALENPLVKPLMHLTILVSPLLWLMNQLSYMNGTAHLAGAAVGFSDGATRGNVDLTARLATRHSPAVQSKGNLGMFAWDASDVLAGARVPALIVAGDDDIITLDDASQHMQRAMPTARLVEVDDVGHMGFMERHADYHRAIADFADAVFAAQRSGGGGGEADGPVSRAGGA